MSAFTTPRMLLLSSSKSQTIVSSVQPDGSRFDMYRIEADSNHKPHFAMFFAEPQSHPAPSAAPPSSAGGSVSTLISRLGAKVAHHYQTPSAHTPIPHASAPQMQPYVPPPPQGYYPPAPAGPLLTANNHSMSSQIDVVLPTGEMVAMERPGAFSSGHQFTHASLGQVLLWKQSDDGGGMNLFGPTGQMVAQFRRKSSMLGCMSSKDSHIEIFEPVSNRLALDLLVLTGVAAAEYRRVTDKAYTNAAVDVAGAF